MVGWSALPHEWIQTGGGIMKVGDLVQWHNKYADVIWCGIITKRSSQYRFHVEWVSGKQGWFHVDDLEVICK